MPNPSGLLEEEVVVEVFGTMLDGRIVLTAEPLPD
jgi:hypothetical protein